MDHLRTASKDVRRVSLADKLHNARSILMDLRRNGDATWKRFNGGKEGTLWYYRSLVEIFEQVDHSPMVKELARTVKNIEEIAKD
jgi:(p)ppGpp synthase/HD superfamily hydrolase